MNKIWDSNVRFADYCIVFIYILHSFPFYGIVFVMFFSSVCKGTCVLEKLEGSVSLCVDVWGIMLLLPCEKISVCVCVRVVLSVCTFVSNQASLTLIPVNKGSFCPSEAAQV